ncbi:MAG: formylglycine-generating enzyme family protein, partial [Alphaproteobacteria bacterium]|nr:formylglycine-generating enzyme family protein [Alphaproteobacteria bacterium]
STQGSRAGEAGRSDAEAPQRRVRIGAALAVGVHEVTRGEYAAFVAATGLAAGSSCWSFDGGAWKDTPGRSWRDPGYSQDDRHPAVCVSWDDAKAYAAWLSQGTGQRYRLLSESEWE